MFCQNKISSFSSFGCNVYPFIYLCSVRTYMSRTVLRLGLITKAVAIFCQFCVCTRPRRAAERMNTTKTQKKEKKSNIEDRHHRGEYAQRIYPCFFLLCISLFLNTKKCQIDEKIYFVYGSERKIIVLRCEGASSPYTTRTETSHTRNNDGKFYTLFVPPSFSTRTRMTTRMMKNKNIKKKEEKMFVAYLLQYYYCASRYLL